MLTKDQFLGSFRRTFREVETPIGTLRIRNLTEGEKQEFEAGSLKADGKLNLSFVRSQRRRLVALCLVDDDGQPLLTDASDVARLKDVDAAVIVRLFDAATEHCGFSAEEVEELGKNYDAATAEDSPTG